MLNYFRSTMQPEGYHGKGKTGPFFEGWYYKLVSADEKQRWCIIPGVYIGKDPKNLHAFIQVMDGVSGKSIYQSYPFADFRSEKDEFKIHIAENHFSRTGIILNIDHPQMKITGTLKFVGTTPWPVKLTSPGIMGWYAWVPGMECYHGVVSLNHRIQGSLLINGAAVDFSDGIGYIEKDWGLSFPSAWVWTQTNHFKTANVSLTASAANIPWRGSSFRGFIAGLWLQGKLYKFATYTGAKLNILEISDTTARMQMSDSKYRLEVSGHQGGGGIAAGADPHPDGPQDRRDPFGSGGGQTGNP